MPLKYAFVALCVLSLGACDAPAEAPGFIALSRDFDGFWAWQRLSIDPVAHVAVYANRPPSASGAIPVGTILVKTIEDGPPSTWTIHAMVQRGGGFNREGGGWEWFELFLDEEHHAWITWRGAHAPVNRGYLADLPSDGGVAADAGLPIASDCASCHARGDDFLLTRGRW